MKKEKKKVGRKRRTDYLEAKRLRAEGLTYQAIGERLHISPSNAFYACQPDPTGLMRAQRSYKDWVNG